MDADATTQSFDWACAYLFPRLGHADRWSLEPTRRLLETLGNPQDHFPTVHIGGTNGKGSVATMIYEVMRAAGWSVGLYTSPHLVDVTERIVVDGTPISHEGFAEWTSRMQEDIEEADASFFEASTAMALAHFASSLVDVVVAEVGLGGRLDSTNVVQPVVSAVTTVGPDHKDYLGESLAEIALEKAAIAKPGVPFVVGEPDPALGSILECRAVELGAKPVAIASDAEYTGPLRLRGAHQRRNAVVAQTILAELPGSLKPSGEAVRRGLEAAWLPGRFDRRGQWIFDVAHNQPGIHSLVRTLSTEGVIHPLHVLLGVMSDKPLGEMIGHLQSVSDSIVLTIPPSAPVNRRLPEDVGRGLPEGVRFEPDFDHALGVIQAGAGSVLVTGSFHTVGDAMTRLPGFQPFG